MYGLILNKEQRRPFVLTHSQSIRFLRITPPTKRQKSFALSARVPSFERDRPPGGSPLVTPQLNGGPARRAVKNKDDGPAHHGANGAAMPTDEDDQYGHFFFNHPEREGYSAA